MDANADWRDFHFLNISLLEAVESNPGVIDISRVQLSYRSKQSSSRGASALDGLALEYFTHAPLNYIFNRQAMRSYNSFFVFLIKIQRAKSSLERISFRALNRSTRSALKVFFGTRSRLLWFVK
jgi:hypothetical protein